VSTKPAAPIGAHMNHSTELELGGRGRRSSNLRVLEPLALPDDWEMKPGVPPTRAACKGAPRPCPYVHCRHHLWLTEASARPGRRHVQAEGGAPESTLQPYTSASCALDIAENPHGRDSRNQLTYGDVGAYFGVSDERARIIAEKALAKLKLLGYTLDDLLAPAAP
jgi:hypothetical protein